MATFQEKVRELQSEVDELDKRLQINSKYSVIIFSTAVAVPFIVAFLLYMISPKFVMMDDAHGINRKKMVKWAILFSIIIWVGLYFTNMYFNRKIKVI